MTTVGCPDDPDSIADVAHYPRNAIERGHVIEDARHVIRYLQSDPHVDFIESMHFPTVADTATFGTLTASGQTRAPFAPGATAIEA